MKKFLMALAVTTMAVSPMVIAQAQAAPHQTSKKVTHKAVYKASNQKSNKTVHDKRGNRVVTKTVVVQRAAPSRHSNSRYAVSQNQRNWAKGQRFDRRYATNYRVIDNPRAYRLSSAPRGYQWVRSGNDAVLIGLTSGIVGAVIGNAIYR